LSAAEFSTVSEIMTEHQKNRRQIGEIRQAIPSVLYEAKIKRG
jgi:hypothetical protein